MSQTKENLLPTAEEPKLIDRPAAERLQDELSRRDGHTPNDAGPEPPHPHHVPRAKVILVIGLLALIVIVVALAGYLPRQRREKAAAEAAQEEATSLPTVTVSKVRFA